jgi:hypothetical protein
MCRSSSAGSGNITTDRCERRVVLGERVVNGDIVVRRIGDSR